MAEQKKLCLYSTENGNGVKPLEKECRGCYEMDWDDCRRYNETKGEELKKIGGLVEGLAYQFRGGCLK